jgi:murein DD-endopeptidase MepM/ murein hydrolase activator NlpD
MAFIRATGKHRAPSRARRRVSAGAAGIAGLAAVGVVGSVAPPALADTASSASEDTGFTQAIDMDGAVAEAVIHQADAQQVAAEQAQVEAAAEQAAAAAKQQAKEAKQKADEAKRKAAAKAAAKARAEKAEREREAKERAARAAAAKRAKLNGYVAPVSSPQVTTPYQAGGGLWSSGTHSGIDFAAASGTPVKAVAAGEVVEAGDGGAYGNNIVIRHKDGHYSQYGHLLSLGVSVGQTVSSGQQIALSGSTGNSTGPHLHFEIRTGPDYGADIDPLAYMRQKGVTL